MANAKKASSAKSPAVPKGIPATHQLIDMVSKRHDIAPRHALNLIVKFIERAEQRNFSNGWWLELLDAQFLTHLGRYSRVRCGSEVVLSHLTPEPGECCHDCGCMLGEYHVFGCDSEECSNCRDQAFCCDCDVDQEEADSTAREQPQTDCPTEGNDVGC